MALYINGNKASGGTDIVHLTQAQYDALPSSKNYDGKVYMITDVNGDGSQFQPVIYSETEREIGVWIDGKPLYQKTIIFEESITGSGNTWLSTNINVNYIDRLLNGIAYASGVPYNVSVGKSSNNILEFMHFRNAESTFIGLTIQYTKTTDQAGSGTWTPQGVPAVHYSTDEQVVGTWIDGNTIYKKTFYNVGGVAQSLNIAHGINNLDKCIKYEGTAYDSNDSSRVYVLPRIDYGSVDIGIDHINSTNIVVGINNNFQTRIIDIYITIYYTKTQGGA